MKTEDDRSQKNLVKKMKKHKTEPISCVVDKESRGEVGRAGKKCNKVKEIDVKHVCDGSEKGETKKKKKRKIICDSDVKDEAEDGVSKKKKKKHLVEVETLETAVNEVVREKKQKKNKKKNKSIEPEKESENIKIENGENGDCEVGNVTNITKKKKKKILAASTESSEKKKKKKLSPVEVTNEATQEEIGTKKTIKREPDQNGTKTKKDKVNKKKQKKSKIEPESPTENNEVKCQKFKSKKRKEKQEKLTNEELQEGVIIPKNRRNKSAKDLNNVGEGEAEPKKDGHNVKEEKRKKELVHMDGVEEKVQRKRKNLKAKGDNEEPLVIKCEKGEEELRLPGGTARKKGKQKKSSAKVENEVETGLGVEPGTKRKKIKKEKKNQEELKEWSQSDVVFLCEKTGNSDEVIINQERRQALQMEVDRASQPQKPAERPGLGQWSTAQFSSSEQQQKFLRLMGGFKKGFQSANGSTGGANMAMGKDAQQQLQQGLLGEFERAHSRRMDFSNRGAGLGYSASLNKKFSIDVNACRSVRFDD